MELDRSERTQQRRRRIQRERASALQDDSDADGPSSSSFTSTEPNPKPESTTGPTDAEMYLSAATLPSQQEELHRHLALITQEPAAPSPPTHPLAKRASVVTVFTTQTGVNTGGNGAVQNGNSIPIGIIVGSVAVGVALAVGIVGVYLWWGKRDPKASYNRNRYRAKASLSNTRLALSSPASPGSPGDEKNLSLHTPPSNHRHGSSPRSQHTKSPSSTSTIPTLRTNSPSSPARAHLAGSTANRTPFSASPATEGPVQATRRSSSLPSAATEKPRADDKDMEQEHFDSTPPSSRPGTEKSYAPQKSSPLAIGGGSRSKPKPKERAKINEWARPMSPTSPTRSKESAHSGEDEGADRQLQHLPTSPPQQHLQSPQATSPESSSATTTTAVGSPIPGHVHKKSTSDGSADTGSSGSFSAYYMHDAPKEDVDKEVEAGGDEVARPALVGLEIPRGTREGQQPTSPSQVPLPLSSSSSNPMPGSWQYHGTSSSPVPPTSPPSHPSPSSYPPPALSHAPPPSSWATHHHAATQSSSSFGPGPRAFSRQSQLSNDTYYTGMEDHHTYANTSHATIPYQHQHEHDPERDAYEYGDDAGLGDGEVRDSMIGMAYGGEDPTPYDPNGQRSFVVPPIPGQMGDRPGSAGTDSSRRSRKRSGT